VYLNYIQDLSSYLTENIASITKNRTVNATHENYICFFFCENHMENKRKECDKKAEPLKKKGRDK